MLVSGATVAQRSSRQWLTSYTAFCSGFSSRWEAKERDSKSEISPQCSRCRHARSGNSAQQLQQLHSCKPD